MDTTLSEGIKPRQVGSGEERSKSLGRPTLYALVLLGLYLSYRVLSPFFTALTWAVMFAILFRGMQAALAQRMGPKRAALVTTLVVTLVIVAPVALLVSTLAHEMPQVTEYLKQSSHTVPSQFDQAWAKVRAKVPVPLPEDPREFVNKATQRAVGFLAPRASGFLGDSFAALGSVVSMLFALFFMLRDGNAMSRQVRERLPFPEQESDRLMTEVRDLVMASVGAGLIVAAAQGLIGGLTFWLLHMSAPAFWGVVMGFCSLLPVVGATIVWVPAGIGLLLSGEITRGVLMLLIGFFGISMVDNILRPILLSGKTSVSGLIVFFGLLGGTAAFGLVGLVIGPIILVITPQILDTLRLRPVDEPESTERPLATRAG
jgi:predicted PurR-regulated permease PerM